MLTLIILITLLAYGAILYLAFTSRRKINEELKIQYMKEAIQHRAIVQNITLTDKEVEQSIYLYDYLEFQRFRISISRLRSYTIKNNYIVLKIYADDLIRKEYKEVETIYLINNISNQEELHDAFITKNEESKNG